MDRAVTLLPEPLSPTRQTVSPGFIVSETPSTARTALAPRPNSSVRFLISNKNIVRSYFPDRQTRNHPEYGTRAPGSALAAVNASGRLVILPTRSPASSRMRVGA